MRDAIHSDTKHSRVRLNELYIRSYHRFSTSIYPQYLYDGRTVISKASKNNTFNQAKHQAAST